MNATRVCAFQQAEQRCERLVGKDFCWSPGTLERVSFFGWHRRWTVKTTRFACFSRRVTEAAHAGFARGRPAG